ELEQAAARLNEHGFALEHTASELFPKIQRILAFLEQPLVAAAIPWVIRRALARPYRRRSLIGDDSILSGPLRGQQVLVGALEEGKGAVLLSALGRHARADGE